ncbi:MAG TPA: hypothetical protein VE969_00555 [Pyrinomonadaceae bacterium]|jgi:hypothetical protein|nr:hypothetical protein [Pyrinomonadaceae bacterium]
MRKLNWPIWLGLLLSFFAFFSYPFIFVNWATTRDFPWANFIIFALADVFIVIGVKRAFAPERRILSKILGGVGALLSGLVLVGFIFVAFVASRQLPPSANAPQVGQKAPAFTLTDTNNKQMSLSDLLTQPIPSDRAEMVSSARPPKGLLLIFYRGYW